jgi:broad specificity phosphatase PhoE
VSVLYLLRHGETHWNVEQRMQGRGDSPLTERGREQVRCHADVLVASGVDRLMVSPAGRTRASAEILMERLRAGGMDVPATYHDALMERHCGDWEGMTIAEIQARYPENWAAREQDGYLHRPPGGESHADMEQRVAALLESIRTDTDRIALVTHGVMSRVILKLLLGLDPAEAMQLRHPNALFYRLEFAPDGIRRAHFLGGAGPFDGLLGR